MLKIPLHSNKKLVLAFEFGIAIADVAKEQNVKVDKELIERAEKILLHEFQTRGAQYIANNWTALLLSVFETN